YERLRSIFGELEAEAKELLERELTRLNGGAAPGAAAARLLGRWRRRRNRSGDGHPAGAGPAGAGAAGAATGTRTVTAAGVAARLLGRGPARRVVSAEGRWFIRFQEDPNGALEPGDIQVVSEFAQQPAVGYGSGTPTHRISTTRRLGRSTSQRETTDPS